MCHSGTSSEQPLILYNSHTSEAIDSIVIVIKFYVLLEYNVVTMNWVVRLTYHIWKKRGPLPLDQILTRSVFPFRHPLCWCEPMTMN
jgi:hypothetical protein